MPGRISQSQSLARQVRLAVEANSARFGRSPAVTLVTGDIGLRAMLDKRLRDRGCDVTLIADGSSFHERVRSGTLDGDVLIVDEALTGCSPFHGLGYARKHGLDAPTIALVRIEDELARTEARRLDLVLCGRAIVLGSLDRVLLMALRRCLERRASFAA